MTKRFISVCLLSSILILIFGSILQFFYGASDPHRSGHTWGSDDAYISYRYAENLFHGNGLVFNPGEKIEGYSSLLYALMVTPAFLLGKSSIYIFSTVLNIVLAIVCLVLFAQIIKRQLSSTMWGYGTLLLALNPILWIHINTGLESILILLLQLAIWYFLENHLDAPKKRQYLIFTALALSLLLLARVDGFVFGAFICLYLLLRHEFKLSALFFLISAVIEGSYMLIRYAYYGDILNAPYYAKVSGLLTDRLHHGLQDFGQFIMQAGYWPYLICLVLLLLILIQRKSPRVHKDLIFPYTCTIFLGIYWIYIGGDVFGERFLLLLYPLGIYIFLALLSRFNNHQRLVMIIWPLIAINSLLLISSDLRLLYTQTTTPQYNMWLTLGQFLKNSHPSATVAIDAAGRVPFLSELYTIDMLGLNDKHISKLDVSDRPFKVGHNKFDADYIIERKPDLIAAWITPTFDLAWGLDKQKYRSDYHLLYLVNSNPVSEVNNIINVEELSPKDISTWIKKGFRYAVLTRGKTPLMPIDKLDFKDPSDSYYLDSGFSSIERSTNQSWIWNDGNNSTLTIPLAPHTTYQMNISAMPAHMPNRQQSITIIVNKNHVGTIPLLNPEYATYTITIPEEYIQSENAIEFHYAYTISPHDQQASNPDTRKLAVNFQEISFQAVTEPE